MDDERTFGRNDRAASYRRAARAYDRVIGPLMAGSRAAALRALEPRPGMRVLDVGCGTGVWLAEYAAAGGVVAGVDRSRPMLERAAARLARTAVLVEGDAGALPFADGAFDVVGATTLLHEIAAERRVRVLSEMRRVAAGVVVVIDFRSERPDTAAGRAARMLTRAIERIAGGDHWRNSRQFLASGGVPALASEAGLRVQRVELAGGGALGVYLLA